MVTRGLRLSHYPEACLQLPPITRTDVRLLWHFDFYDGPISGMLLFNGRRCWFQMVAENEEPNGWYRRFLIVALSEEQIATEERWHELFREHVGHHTDYDAEGHRNSGTTRPREEWDHFYRPYGQREPLDLSRNDVLAYLEW